MISTGGAFSNSFNLISSLNGGGVDALTIRRSLEARLEAQRNSSVLNLQDCCIGDEGCHILATFLQKYTAITDLELRGNQIGSEGIILLGNVLRTSTTIKTISLDWNNLGHASE